MFNLEWVFIFCFAIGIIYAVFAGVFAGIFGGVLHHGHDLPGGHDVDVSHDVDVAHDADISHDVDHSGDVGGGHEVHFSPVSPPVVAMFLAGFGGMGLLGMKSLHWTSTIGLFSFALASALVLGSVTFFLFFWIMKNTQVTSVARASDAVGATADVIVPLPSHGTGEIAYTACGRRFNAPARSTDGRPIPQGRKVVVEKLDGSVHVVREESRS
ncbi:MAG: NfeD family protein [Planctomycetota bacterium]